MAIRLTVLALFLAAPAVLADAPERHVVSGVPAGDVLNVRAAPSAASADIGDLAEGAEVEVLGEDPHGKWGRIVHGEGNGWVALRFLQPVEPARVGDSPIPTGLTCTGTEPFWSLATDAPDAVTFAEPGPDGIAEDRARVQWAGAASGRSGFPAALRARGAAADYALVLRPAACNDGMSGRDYGWSAEVLTGERLLTGCCRLGGRGK